MAIHQTTWLFGKGPGSGERHFAISGNTSDTLAIGAGPGSGEGHFAISGNTLENLAFWAGPCSGERYFAISGNTLESLAFGAGPGNGEGQYTRQVGFHFLYYREKREQELDSFLNKKYNRLGQKIEARVDYMNGLKSNPDLILK